MEGQGKNHRRPLSAAEVKRLCDCPDCAFEQARVLESVGRDEGAELTRGLAAELSIRDFRFDDVNKSGDSYFSPTKLNSRTIFLPR